MLGFTLNGAPVRVETDPAKPLLWVIRENLGLTGTKFGCGAALCGACTVIVDGEAMRSCSVPVSEVAGKAVRTIEGLAAAGALSRLQQAWLAEQVPQCGYCQAGFLMAATALLERNPSPTRADIEGEILNLCRCGTYPRVVRAIERASVSA